MAKPLFSNTLNWAQKQHLAKIAGQLDGSGESERNANIVRLMRAFVLHSLMQQNDSDVQEVMQRETTKIKMDTKMRSMLTVSGSVEGEVAQMHGYSDRLQAYIEETANATGVSFTELQGQVDQMIAEGVADVVFMGQDKLPEMAAENLDDTEEKKEKELQQSALVTQIETHDRQRFFERVTQFISSLLPSYNVANRLRSLFVDSFKNVLSIFKMSPNPSAQNMAGGKEKELAELLSTRPNR